MKLPGKIRSSIFAYKQLYDIGLHGPDILFYYKPLVFCPVNQQGYDMHGRSGRTFFENAAKVLQGLEAEEKKAALAYVYGFCCHFALDVSCHAYIDEKISASGISHTEIEVEFDRSLMIKDGYPPLTHQLITHINPAWENAEVIQKFYENITADEVMHALEGMIRYNRLLIAPSHLKRYMIYALLRMSGNYKEMHGLLVNHEANPECADSTAKLYKLYDDAVQLAVKLIEEFKDSAAGDLPFHEKYDYTFGGKYVMEPEYNKDDSIVRMDGKVV